MTRAQIGWGVRGKPPGSHDEYAVLASGGEPFGPDDLAAILARYSPGTPPSGRNTAASLPWVTFSHCRDDHRQYLGMAHQDWSRDVDGAGRPISLSRYFYLPYTLVAEQGISYRGLYEALRSAEPPAAGAALEAELPGTPVRERAASVERLGVERVTVSAALLLEGPVTVTHAEELSVEDRLDFIDAVAALLPCGWRTRFTASTWHADGSRHLQLVFARQARAGSAELDWRSPRQPAGAATAAAYLKVFADLTVRRKRPLTGIIGFLADRTEPMAADPGAALRALEESDLPGAVLTEVRAGRTVHPRLHALFASERVRELPDAEDRRYLLNTLVELADAADLPVIEPLWTEIGGDREHFVQGARENLLRGDPADAPSAYFHCADRLRFADLFLARLAELADADSGPAVAGLLHAHLRPEHDQAMRALAGRTGLLCAFVHRLAADPEADLALWFAHLARYASRDLLLPFAQVLTTDGTPIDRAPAAALFAGSPRSFTVLLRAAAARARLGRVLPVFAVLLTEGPAADRASWAAVVASLEPAHAADGGVLDALLLWSGGRPRHMAASTGDWAAYQESFDRVCALEAVRADLPELLTRLADHLREWRWYDDPLGPAAVLGLAEAYETFPEPARAVLAGRAEAPGLLADARFAAWRERAFARMPYLREDESMLTLTGLRPDADADAAARLCAEAIVRGVSLPTIATHLARSDWRLGGVRTMDLLNALRSALRREGRSRRTAEDFAVSLSREILHRQPPSTLPEFRASSALETVAEIKHRYDLLHNIMADLTDPEIVHMSEQTRQDLLDLADYATRLAKSGSPRKRFLR